MSAPRTALRPPWRARARLLAAVVVAAGLAACGGESETDEQTSSSRTSTKGEGVIEAIDQYIEEKKAAGEIDTSANWWKTDLPRFPKVEFPEGQSLFWNVKTNVGDLRVRFLPEVAPNHVANFVYLTRLGFFDGLIFHRVIPEFMAQGGDPLGTGTGGPGYQFDGEFSSEVRHDKPGLLSMANAGPGTDGSQFFLTFVATPWLDDNHTIFGEVVEGMDTLKELEKRGSRSGETSERLVIEDASVEAEAAG